MVVEVVLEALAEAVVGRLVVVEVVLQALMGCMVVVEVILEAMVEYKEDMAPAGVKASSRARSLDVLEVMMVQMKTTHPHRTPTMTPLHTLTAATKLTPS